MIWSRITCWWLANNGLSSCWRQAIIREQRLSFASCWGCNCAGKWLMTANFATHLPTAFTDWATPTSISFSSKRRPCVFARRFRLSCVRRITTIYPTPWLHLARPANCPTGPQPAQTDADQHGQLHHPGLPAELLSEAGTNQVVLSITWSRSDLTILTGSIFLRTFGQRKKKMR